MTVLLSMEDIEVRRYLCFGALKSLREVLRAGRPVRYQTSPARYHDGDGIVCVSGGLDGMISSVMITTSSVSLI